MSAAGDPASPSPEPTAGPTADPAAGSALPGTASDVPARSRVETPGAVEGGRPGRLLVLAGPSGVGKSSVVAELRRMGADLWFSVSATTRAVRPGEVDGRDYRFVTPEEFTAMIAAGELLEWAEIHRGMHRSGTPRRPVEEHLAAGDAVLLEVDLAGARAVRRARPDAVLVFLAPPSWDDLVGRLVGRATEPAEVVERRLATAREELAAYREFDMTVVNHDVPGTARRLVELATGPLPAASTEPVPGPSDPDAAPDLPGDCGTDTTIPTAGASE